MCWFRKLFVLLILLIIMVADVSLAQAQEETGTVNGFVRREGNPYAWARVVVISQVTAVYEGTAFTDEQGHFSLSGVPAGGQVEIAVFNEEDQVIGKGTGILNQGEEVISVDILAQ